LLHDTRVVDVSQEQRTVHQYLPSGVAVQSNARMAVKSIVDSSRLSTLQGEHQRTEGGNMQHKQLFTVKEVAKFLSISVPGVWTKSKRGKFPETLEAFSEADTMDRPNSTPSYWRS
jgi:hypothetical protein